MISAAFFVNLAALLTIRSDKVTVRKNSPEPTSACQPIKDQRINISNEISRGDDSTKPNLFKDFSSFWASLETKFIVLPDNVSSKR